jgi:hypothetical protein
VNVLEIFTGTKIEGLKLGNRSMFSSMNFPLDSRLGPFNAKCFVTGWRCLTEKCFHGPAVEWTTTH